MDIMQTAQATGAIDAMMAIGSRYESPSISEGEEEEEEVVDNDGVRRSSRVKTPVLKYDHTKEN